MMRHPVALCLILLSFITVCCFLVSKVGENGARERILTTLVAGNETRTFRTLVCNENLSIKTCDTPWSSMFTNTTVHSSKVVIPCGQCVTMDHSSSSTLVLEGGIDIQGKLVFPDGYKLAVQTPYVLVQGELHMYSTKIPNGEPDIRFVLTGTDENVTQFIPVDSNRNQCDGDDGESCHVGKKPIVVAGGKLVIKALPQGFPTWVNLYDAIPADSSSSSRSSALILTDRVKGQWGIGAQVLITSHTQRYDDEQVRTITNIKSHSEPGYVNVELDSSILRPTTASDNPNFAVEVALLARNIVFEGASDDPNELYGAHLIVYHTPSIKQKLEGVEFRNFGQQGKLGRYPIHFHLSGYVTGSTVSKNLIRESNQRCIVVHGTHYLNIESNVAYDTFGHCFMTEDGQEQYNVFRDNLGALTRRVNVLIPEDGRIDGEETDDRPSTFWMTNPTNSWEGNVAAGSQDNGFWLELRSSVRGPEADLYPDFNPRKAPLTLFKDNVAHSNRNKGIRTYPQGFEPPGEAMFVGCRSYRNEEDGVFFHNSKDLSVIGGVYADNREQLDFDRAEYITLRDAEVIGVSPEFRKLLQTQNVGRVCRYDKVVGVQLHTFTRHSRGIGASLQNVRFSGFVDTGCDKAFAIDFDDEVRRGTFDYFSVLENIFVEEGAVPVDLCEAKEQGVDDIWVTDLHSSLQSSTSRSFSGASTIITEDSWISTFLSSDDCLVFANQCLAYCKDTCLRTVTYQVDPTVSEQYKMRVCNDTGTCIEVNNTFWYEEEDTEVETLVENTRVDRFRYFAVTLPKGSYVAQIIDSNGGKLAWPTFVEEIYQDTFCANSLEIGSVELNVPKTTASECKSLIRNGNAEASSENHTYWLHRHGGVSLLPGMGIDGSNAFGQLNSTEADRDALAQFLDVRCLDLMRGRQYEVVAFVKLQNETTGDSYDCTPSAESRCPEVGLYWKSVEERWSRDDVATVVAAASPDSSGFQRLHGILDVTDEVSDASIVFLYIRRHAEGTILLVDNVSMTLVSIDDRGDCDNLVYNGNFSIGDSRYWFNGDDGALAMVSPGFDGSSDYAVTSFEGNMEQYIRIRCMKPRSSYSATAKFKLIGTDGREFACRKRRATDETRCPVMQLRIQVNGNHDVDTVASLAGDSSDTEWNTLLGGFEAKDDFVNAESIRVQFRSVPNGATLVVDSVVISEYSSACRLGVAILIVGMFALTSLDAFS